MSAGEAEPLDSEEWLAISAARDNLAAALKAGQATDAAVHARLVASLRTVDELLEERERQRRQRSSFPEQVVAALAVANLVEADDPCRAFDPGSTPGRGR